MTGARVYEPEDYERAIDLVAADALPLDRLISSVEPLERPAGGLRGPGRRGRRSMKILVDCRA